jgi:hypothetical protein
LLVDSKLLWDASVKLSHPPRSYPPRVTPRINPAFLPAARISSEAQPRFIPTPENKV